MPITRLALAPDLVRSAGALVAEGALEPTLAAIARIPAPLPTRRAQRGREAPSRRQLRKGISLTTPASRGGTQVVTRRTRPTREGAKVRPHRTVAAPRIEAAARGRAGGGLRTMAAPRWVVRCTPAAAAGRGTRCKAAPPISGAPPAATSPRRGSTPCPTLALVAPFNPAGASCTGPSGSPGASPAFPASCRRAFGSTDGA